MLRASKVLQQHGCARRFLDDLGHLISLIFVIEGHQVTGKSTLQMLVQSLPFLLNGNGCANDRVRLRRQVLLMTSP